MSSYLIHYGVKGQRWHDRKYQYEDGSLTPEGKIHYGVGQGRKSLRQKSSSSKTSKKEYVKKSNRNAKSNSTVKTKKTSYNAHKDMKRSVKSIEKDKSAFDKANEFLSTPVGRMIVGTAISGIVGIGVSILKEQVLVDLKYKNKKNEYMSEKDYNDKVKDETSKLHRVNVNGKKTQADIEKGFKVYEAASDFSESMDAIKKKKQE